MKMKKLKGMIAGGLAALIVGTACASQQTKHYLSIEAGKSQYNFYVNPNTENRAWTGIIGSQYKPIGRNGISEGYNLGVSYACKTPKLPFSLETSFGFNFISPGNQTYSEKYSNLLDGTESLEMNRTSRLDFRRTSIEETLLFGTGKFDAGIGIGMNMNSFEYNAQRKLVYKSGLMRLDTDDRIALKNEFSNIYLKMLAGFNISKNLSVEAVIATELPYSLNPSGTLSSDSVFDADITDAVIDEVSSESGAYKAEVFNDMSAVNWRINLKYKFDISRKLTIKELIQDLKNGEELSEKDKERLKEYLLTIKSLNSEKLLKLLEER